MSTATASATSQTATPETAVRSVREEASPCRSSSGDTRIALRGVDFATYAKLCEARTERGVRLSFDGKDLEIMSPGYEHEDARKLLGKLVEALLLELQIPYVDLGSTRFKQTEAGRGLEPDECYVFDPAKIEAFRIARASGIGDAEEAGCPVPDLAIEVDFSTPQIDRPGIYAALQVHEIWRLTRKRLMIDRLLPDGSYRTLASSEFLSIRADEILKWINDPATWNRLDWLQRLQAWIREELVPRIARDRNAAGTESETPQGTETA